MRRLLVSIALLMFASTLAAKPLRRSVVLAVGEQQVYTSGATIATVTTPAGISASVVTYAPEQYGNNITLRATRKGETKLLIESTESKIAEVLRVIVGDKVTVDRYRFVTGSLAGVEGLSASDVHLAGNSVVITGTVFSPNDLQRCRALETSAPKNAPTRCVAALSDAVPAVSETLGYDAAANLIVEEQPLPAPAGGMEGSEGDSQWRATLRLGDVPILTMQSANRSDMVMRAAQFASKLNQISSDWKIAADQARQYPATFSVKAIPNGYNIVGQWKFDQGTKGEPLIALHPDELQAATMQSGGGVERLVQWWAALLQDSFRMYNMASLPALSASAANSPLRATYEHAVALHKGQLDRTSAAPSIARAVAAQRWSSGLDPFASLLTSIPSDFHPAPMAR